MNENETTTATETVTEIQTNGTAKTSTNVTGYVTAVVIATLIILGVLYVLEKDGRSSTNLFDSIIVGQVAKATVAVVNGEEIINADLNTSIQQFTQAATAQGVDITNPQAQADIRNQALDVLVNTRLLKQDALSRGFSVSEEAAAERLATIETEIGGPEILKERMTVLNINAEQLSRDIQDELLIQQLLEVIFVEANVTVSEEEIIEFYETAGGAEAGLPAIETISEQIDLQIRTSKEQEAIDKYLANLKTTATIEIK